MMHPIVYLGALAGYVLAGPYSSPTFEALSFILVMGVAAVPAHAWLQRRPASLAPNPYYLLACNGLVATGLPLLPSGLRLVFLAVQGVLITLSATIGIAELRAALDQKWLSAALGAISGIGILMAWGVEGMAYLAPSALSGLVQAVPFLVAGLAFYLAPGHAQGLQPARPQAGERRTMAVASLICLAGALVAAQALPPGQTGIANGLGCLVGVGLCAFLLYTDRDTLCSQLGAAAAILASLSPAPIQGPIAGLALGLLLPVPAYTFMIRLGRDGAILSLIAVQAAVPALLFAYPAWTPVSNNLLLGSSLLLLLAMGFDTPSEAGPQVPSDAPELPEAPEDLASPVEVPVITPIAPEAAPDLLRTVFGELLTPRELEVGQLAITGISTREIAAHLFLTESTVKTHLKNLYRKTETANRNDLYRRLMSAVSAEQAVPSGAVRYVTVLETSPRDALTGLLSRQTFDQVAAERVMVELAHRRPAAILLMALRVSGGTSEQKEKALAVVSGILQASLRDGDLLFRYDEHTFAVILPGSDEAGAQYASRRLGDRVRAWAATHPLVVSLQVGWACTADGVQNVSRLLADAQQRMAAS